MTNEIETEARPDAKNDDYWCWRVRFYFKTRYGGHLTTSESACDGAFPPGTTALQAITEVAKWREVNLDTVYSIEAERLLPDPHTER